MPAGVSAWTPLANITLTGTQTTVTFSSISGSYRDLILVGANVLSSTNNEHMQFRINSDSGANYNMVTARGDGSSTASSSSSNTTEANFGTFVMPNTTSPSNFVLHFLDYSATDKHKTVLARSDNANSTFPGASMTAIRWASTSAITSITLRFQSTATYAVGSSFALYGVSS